MRTLDVTGRTFGRLTVVSRNGSDPRGKALWLCACSCGQAKTISGATLASGRIQSCGCLHREVAQATGYKNAKHGQSRGGPRFREYIAWKGMIRRCTNPRSKDWKDYGGRGITVAPEWRDSFDAFFAHIGPKPSPDLSLDRIEANGNYEPGNVRWATALVQRHNRRQPQATAASTTL